jgi:hypothetical protein
MWHNRPSPAASILLFASSAILASSTYAQNHGWLKMEYTAHFFLLKMASLDHFSNDDD